MPGKSDNLVQQGIVFLVCGDMSDDTSSRVYVVSRTVRFSAILS